MNYANYIFRAPEAKRLASLGGIVHDLQGVVEYCNLLIERSDFDKFNHTEWEAISSAAVVRYARCFVSGKRDFLRDSLLDSADRGLQRDHQFFMALRDK